MIETPTLVRRERQPYVSIPIEVTLRNWSEANALVPEVITWMSERGVHFAGPPFFRYWVVGTNEDPFSLEVGVPVAGRIDGDNRVQTGEINPGTYLTAFHRGHPDKIERSQGEMLHWAATNNIEIDVEQVGGIEQWNGRYLFFHTNPADEPDLNKWVTEIAFLIRKRHDT